MPLYEDPICPGCSVACSFLDFYPQKIFVAPMKHEVVVNDEKGKGKLEEVPSTCVSSGKTIDDISNTLKPCAGDIKPEILSGKEGSIPGEKYEKDLSLDTCCSDGSLGISCKLGFDLKASLPALGKKKATFLIKNWRNFLCQCGDCSEVYKNKSVSFLLDKDDSIAEYEKRAKQMREERLQKQDGATLNMFNNLGHIEKVEIMSGIADMKNEMGNFFANRDASRAVTSDDIYELFDNLKKKRRHEM